MLIQIIKYIASNSSLFPASDGHNVTWQSDMLAHGAEDAVRF
jgi:hypothetical protein